MQTNFSPAQLADPAIAASEKILRSCVHCGFCTATCPTYLELGDELDSPRGRIYLIKDMLEGGKPATPEVVKHLDRCLSCLACMTTCPSGVHYMHLIDHARAYVERTHRRPWHDRVMRATLAAILPYPARFRMALRLASLAKPLAPLMRGLPAVGARLSAMLQLAPSRLPAADPSATPGRQVHAALGPRRARVVLMRGCAQSVLDPGINAAAIRLLTRHGVEVVLAEGEGCCGALVHHMGQETAAHAFAARNLAAWDAEIARAEREGTTLAAILTTTSGCGTTLKDYGHLFRHDPAHADTAARVAGLVRDISEYAATLDIQPAPEGTPRLRVAYHAACSLQHGQQVRDAPKRLIQAAGFTLLEVPEGHICCGSAGVYNILQPDIAGRLRARKVRNVRRTKPDLVAAGNIGCLTQIGAGLRETDQPVPVVHLVELIDWASGGPLPAALAATQRPGPEAAARAV